MKAIPASAIALAVASRSWRASTTRPQNARNAMTRAMVCCSRNTPCAVGIPYDPEVDVWRLEFELHREAVTSLKLAPESDAEDTDADIEAELSAEELPHVGTLPKLFAHLDAIFQHLSYHWLRLVTPSATQVRARWPLDPTWALLRREFGRLAAAPPLSPDALAVVRGARYRGRARLLRKMANGLLELAGGRGYLRRLGVAHRHSAAGGEVGGGDAPASRERSAVSQCPTSTAAGQLEQSEGLDQVAEEELRANWR